MTREEIKEAAKVMEAYDNGKEIQFLNEEDDKWIDTPIPLFNWDKYTYRIKPEPKYRPFKSQEECWQEMHKHPDFGWVAAQDSKVIYHINIVGDGYIHIDGSSIVFSTAYSEYEFLDGTPFGIMEEQ